jgi:hypothetical protein
MVAQINRDALQMQQEITYQEVTHWMQSTWALIHGMEL